VDQKSFFFFFFLSRFVHINANGYFAHLERQGCWLDCGDLMRERERERERERRLIFLKLELKIKCQGVFIDKCQHIYEAIVVQIMHIFVNKDNVK